MILESTKDATRSQKLALFKVNSGKNLFITGVAGTGKTTFLNSLKRLTGKTVYLTASTGAAALQLTDGKTISSFFGLGKYNKKTATFRCRHRLDNCILVIDEVWMIGKKQWSFIKKAIALNCADIGSVQIIIVGDHAQMPPIHWDDPLADFFCYEGYFKTDENGDILIEDEMPTVKKVSLDGEILETIELVEIVRQKDAEFIKHLMSIRYTGIRQKDLEFFRRKSKNKRKRGISLVKDRGIMDALNNTIKKGKVEKTYNLQDVPKDVRPYESVDIWNGMKVKIIRNSFRFGYANGDTGLVMDISEDFILVKLDRNKELVPVTLVRDDYEETVKYIIDKKIHRTESVEDGSDNVTLRESYFFDGYCNEGKHYLLEVDYSTYSKHKIGQVHEKSFDRSFLYMPVLPGYYLSVRRAQGATLHHGVIHPSILVSDTPTQYTALSRFTSVKNINFPEEQAEQEQQFFNITNEFSEGTKKQMTRRKPTGPKKISATEQ